MSITTFLNVTNKENQYLAAKKYYNATGFRGFMTKFQNKQIVWSLIKLGTKKTLKPLDQLGRN